MVYELFHLGSNPEAGKRGFTWNNYVPPGTEAPEKQAYVERILDGRELSTRTLNRYMVRPLRLLQLEGLVVNTINANMMLAWVRERFPVKSIFLMRHPCAVIASQSSAGGWGWAANEKALTVPDKLLRDYPRLEDIFAGCSSGVENLAFLWAVQNYVPLQQAPQRFCTTYEWLVERRKKEVRRVFFHLERPVPDEAFAQLDRQSSSGSSYEEKDDLLGAWRERLTPSQVDQILEIVHRVGITCYTDALRPNLDKLPVAHT